MARIDAFFKLMSEQKASDLHLSTNNPPMLRINGDLVPPGERCASTTNRNFRGRQGPLARTHLMSPAMVAAAAVTGRLCDVRPLIAGCKI